jgi:hypothetical protein
MLRISSKERSNMQIFDEVIKIYLEKDLQNCKYLLEEFSDSDALNEYLVFCPIEEDRKLSINMIVAAFEIYYGTKEEINKTILYEFINSLLLFIYNNFDYVNLECVIELLNKICHLKKDKNLLKYLNKKNINFWIDTFEKEDFTDEDQANNEIIMSKDSLPPINPSHFILTEKNKLDDDLKKVSNIGDTEIDKSTKKRMKDIDINYDLMRKLGNELSKIE